MLRGVCAGTGGPPVPQVLHFEPSYLCPILPPASPLTLLTPAPCAALAVCSQAWIKEQNFEKLEDDDKKRVAERSRKNAEIFGADSMEEDIKNLRAHLAAFITRMCR